MVTTPWSENFPLQGIKFPRGGSSGVENGLNNLGWETWVYEQGPLRGQAHSFHSSGWGWNIEPPAWDRRSLLTGSSKGGLSRRDIKSGNHTLPATAGRWEVVEPGPGELSLGLPGTEWSGEMHADKASATYAPSSPRGAGCMSENQILDSETSLETQTDPLVPPYQLHHLGVEPSFPEPQPLSRQDVCSYILGPRDVSCSKRQQLPFGTTGGFGMPVCKVDVTANPPGDLSRRPPMCCLSGQTHGGPWDLLGNSWEQEIQQTSPDGWCAMRDAGPSTYLDLNVPLGSLPSPWESIGR